MILPYPVSLIWLTKVMWLGFDLSGGERIPHEKCNGKALFEARERFLMRPKSNCIPHIFTDEKAYENNFFLFFSL